VAGKHWWTCLAPYCKAKDTTGPNVIPARDHTEENTDQGKGRAKSCPLDRIIFIPVRYQYFIKSDKRPIHEGFTYYIHEISGQKKCGFDIKGLGDLVNGAHVRVF